jgi:protein-S-isoprenylcysteine O-methyltransferase Ste14
MASLETIGWIACLIYASIPSFWLMIHPRAHYWRSRSRSPYRVLLPLWIAMWIVLGLGSARWRHAAIYSSPWMWIPALALFSAGFSIYFQAGKKFSGKQLGGLPEVMPGANEQHLITSGIWARVRHPVYLGHLCEMLAWSMGTGLAVLFVLTAFAVVTGLVMIRLEDKELRTRFGAEYALYRGRVPAVLPRIGR